MDNRLVSGIFTDRELNLMLAFANTAAVAIANASMYSRAEQILAEITRVKELMDNIFSSVGSGIIAMDVNDRVHTFNRAAGEILDVRPEVAVGDEVAHLMQNTALQLGDHLALVKENEVDHSLELSAELPGRGQVALALSLSPLKDSNDMTQGVTVVMDDITHLHEHETTISAMKRILPEGMVDQINEIANIEMGGLRRGGDLHLRRCAPLDNAARCRRQRKTEAPQPVSKRSPPPASMNAAASSTNIWATR